MQVSVLGYLTYLCHGALMQAMRAEQRYLQADVYSFGVTLWELLERKRPYKGMDPYQIQVPPPSASVQTSGDFTVLPLCCSSPLRSGCAGTRLHGEADQWRAPSRHSKQGNQTTTKRSAASLL